MAHHNQIASEAMQAYQAERSAEAALLFRSAASAALELGDRAAWFKYIVWAADATYMRGDMQTSLALLLEARQSEPKDVPQFEAWLARKELFFITNSTRPERARLEQLVTDLRSYATIHRVPQGDLPSLEGNLFLFCGDWCMALAFYEAAWQAHDGYGFLKSDSAYSAALCCLRLGRLAACRDWIVASADFGDEGWVTHHSFQRIELTLRLALAGGQPFASLLPSLRIFTERATSNGVDEVREFIARVHLFDPDAGDPAADFHPTRAELRRPLKNRQDVHYRYDSHLLHLDYRLACLRHAASVPAVDDLYYYQPQQVPPHLTPADPIEFQRRLHKARAAVRSTLRYARHLDNLIECDYRQREVQARSERVEEIARSVQTNLPTDRQ